MIYDQINNNNSGRKRLAAELNSLTIYTVKTLHAGQRAVGLTD